MEDSMKDIGAEGIGIRDDKIVRAQRDAEKQRLALKMRGAMTEAEALLWESLRRNQLGGLHFRRQQVIDGFIADFYCRAARLIVECDGAVHQHQVEYDWERDAVLSTHNLRVLRFTNDAIKNNINSVLNDILTAAPPDKTDSPS